MVASEPTGGRFQHPRPASASAAEAWDPGSGLRLRSVENPLPRATLGDIGLATRVSGPDQFPLTLLYQPFDPRSLAGIQPATLRVFRFDERSHSLRPVWNSGVNVTLRFTWAKIRRPGVYVPIGLPRDWLLLELLRTLAHQRRFAEPDSPEEMHALTQHVFNAFLELDTDGVEQLRRQLARIEYQTSPIGVVPQELRFGTGAVLLPFPLPGDSSMDDLRERIARLDPPPTGLPEEQLFFRPEALERPVAPWHDRDAPVLDNPPPWPPPFPWAYPWPPPWSPLPWPPPWFCWLLSPNWWMYHHDERHTGHASGCSFITSTNAGSLALRHSIAVDGPVISIPSVVNGKVYVGTGNSSAAAGGSGGTLYKIDLATGTIEHTFTFSTTLGAGSGQGYAGIGCSPAVEHGRVYFSGLDGRVYCLDAATLTPHWITDLRQADPVHRQPVTHTVNAEGWTSPLVVDGRVYVGFGEGEAGAFGFVYCLDAHTGDVIWLFCTNQFTAGVHNSPNVIPASAVGSPLPPGFSSAPDPPARGASVWSSCAYNRDLNRIYVGTGNSSPDALLPHEPPYGDGVLALNATTGVFHGFFEPAPSDNYRPDDNDIDVPSSPMLFTHHGVHRLGIGSKNGSFFLLDAATMHVLARRQLLPYDSAGNPFPNVDPHLGPGENYYGVFGTAAVHYGLGRIFVGLGGYSGAIDSTTTPFMRVLDWDTLADAWTTAGINPPRYTVPVPPMYTTPGEAGLGSPAVVNDVVFATTSKPGLYAFDAATGVCLWSAPGLGPGAYCLGAAISGDSVVVGVGNGGPGGHVYVYRL